MRKRITARGTDLEDQSVQAAAKISALATLSLARIPTPITNAIRHTRVIGARGISHLTTRYVQSRMKKYPPISVRAASAKSSIGMALVKTKDENREA